MEDAPAVRPGCSQEIVAVVFVAEGEGEGSAGASVRPSRSAWAAERVRDRLRVSIAFEPFEEVECGRATASPNCSSR